MCDSRTVTEWKTNVANGLTSAHANFFKTSAASLTLWTSNITAGWVLERCSLEPSGNVGWQLNKKKRSSRCTIAIHLPFIIKISFSSVSRRRKFSSFVSFFPPSSSCPRSSIWNWIWVWSKRNFDPKTSRSSVIKCCPISIPAFCLVSLSSAKPKKKLKIN